MTKQDFILEAKKRGLSMDEARAKFAKIDASGGFDDSVKPKATTETPKSGIETAMTAMYPRLTEDAKSGKPADFGTAVKGGLDILSMPGRALAATPALLPGGETFAESMAKTKSDKGGVGGFVGDVIRDPATGASLATGGLAGGAMKAAPILSKLSPLAGKALAGVGVGAAEGLTSGTIHGVDRMTQGESLGSAAKGAALETGVSALGGGVLPVGGVGVGKIGEAVEKSAVPLTRGMYKGLSASTKSQFEPENIYKYKLGGSFKETINKSAEKLNELDTKIDNAIEKVAKEDPYRKIKPAEAIDNFIKKVDSGESQDFFGDEDKAISVANSYKRAFEKKGMSEVELDKAREVKQLLGRKAYKKGVLQTEEGALKDRVGQEIYSDLRRQLEEVVPDVAEPSRQMADIIPIRKAAQQALTHYEGKNKLFGLSDMLTGIGSAGLYGVTGGISAPVGIGIVGTKKALETGRGAALVDVTGKGVKKVSESQLTGSALRSALRGLTDEQIRELSKVKK